VVEAEQTGQKPYPSLTHNFHHEIELVVAIGKGGRNIKAADAAQHIYGYAVGLDMTRRDLQNEMKKQGRPWCIGKAFDHSAPISPVAVTPDELGQAWTGGRVHLTLQSTWNGRKVGMCEAGPEMTFHFGQLIAHICKTRNVRAGSIVGSGTVSNKSVEVKGKPEWPKGYSCIAEKRAIETILDGKPGTEFMKFGDTIRIEMKGLNGESLFGAIEQEVVPLNQV